MGSKMAQDDFVRTSENAQPSAVSGLCQVTGLRSLDRRNAIGEGEKDRD